MDAEKLNHIAERLCSDSWSIYIGEPGNRDWMSIADAILTDGRAVAKAYLKLAKFKEYVHARFDAAGVPTDPDSPHKAEGCRIGGRLDLVLMKYMAVEMCLEGGFLTQAKLREAMAYVQKHYMSDRMPAEQTRVGKDGE